jgi:hypothetical protein
MSEEKKDFVVKDRRIFSQDARETDEVKEEQADSSATGETEQKDKQQAADSAGRDEHYQFPEINFPTFVASLNASALVHLGVIEDPASNSKTKNLPMAKQTIDILSMLAEKTKGNLSGDEENMLKNILYDLRILYVKEKK